MQIYGERSSRNAGHGKALRALCFFTLPSVRSTSTVSSRANETTEDCGAVYLQVLGPALSGVSSCSCVMPRVTPVFTSPHLPSACPSLGVGDQDPTAATRCRFPHRFLLRSLPLTRETCTVLLTSGLHPSSWQSHPTLQSWEVELVLSVKLGQSNPQSAD